MSRTTRVPGGIARFAMGLLAILAARTVALAQGGTTPPNPADRVATLKQAVDEALDRAVNQLRSDLHRAIDDVLQPEKSGEMERLLAEFDRVLGSVGTGAKAPVIEAVAPKDGPVSAEVKKEPVEWTFALGLEVGPSSKEFDTVHRLKPGQGFIVRAVRPGSAAAGRALRPGDAVIRVQTHDGVLIEVVASRSRVRDGWLRLPNTINLDLALPVTTQDDPKSIVDKALRKAIDDLLRTQVVLPSGQFDVVAPVRK